MQVIRKIPEQTQGHYKIPGKLG